MSESLWDESDAPAIKRHKSRKPQPMAAVAPSQPVAYTRPTFTKREAPRDFPMEEAIRACGPILHPDEIAKYQDILNPALKVASKIVDWRVRNGLG